MENKNNLPKPVLEKNTTFDRIFCWYIEGPTYCELTTIEEAQRLRWEIAFSLLTNYHSANQVAKILMTKYQISKSVAYSDIRNSIRLFGDVTKSSKEGYRAIQYAFALKCFQLAEKKGDIAEMNRANANMIKLMALDREDPDMPDFKNLEPHVYNIILPDALLKKLTGLTEAGSLDLSAMRKENAIDIDFIEIKNESNSGEKT